ncbi:MAG: 3-dehydroquinate synthase family protein, partial [Rhizobiaceae bacterium]
MTDVVTVPVSLADRSYDILIGGGLIARAGEEIAARLPGVRAAIVTDENVAALHLAALQQSLTQSGIQSTPIIIPAGEKSKSFGELEKVVRGILAARLERRDVVIAFGGGVVGDLAGFAAGIARRGMPFVQIPTSLLAQVDSSVGGKTGINTPEGKNLVGVFYQPQLVLADTDVLSTLSAREFRAGYAEV